MNEVTKEIEEWFLGLEDNTLDKLRSTYNRSLKDVQAKAKELQEEINKLSLNADPNDEIRQSQIRSKVYQLDYQQRLEKQISNLMDVMNDENVKTVRRYLYNVYHDGFLTEQYRLMNNGLNITMPINQKLLVKAVNTSYGDIPLSTRIYDNVKEAKKSIISEISRGLSIGMSNQDMARNLQNSMGVSMRKAFQIAQNEGARVRQGAIQDSMFEAKKKGADIVKQWLATLDGKTRPTHRELDGQYAEIDEKFKYSGGEVNAPKEFGIASEDINCRCTLVTVPRWDMTDKSWRMDNETKELVEVKNYQDWYNKVYLANSQGLVNTNIVRNYTNNVATTIGQASYDVYMDVLDNCNNEDLRTLYGKYLDEIKINDANYTETANFNNLWGGIYMDISKDQAGGYGQKQCEVFFHESGHNLDWLLSNKNLTTYYSEQFTLNGKTFIEVLKDEVNELVNNVYNSLNDEYIQSNMDIGVLIKNGWGNRAITNYAQKYNINPTDLLDGTVKLKHAPKEVAYSMIEKEIKQLTDAEKSDVSDILKGLTKGKIKCGWGHKLSYYNDTKISREAFAEFTSANVVNNESLKTLNKYLPKASNFYNEMIRKAT